MYLGGGPLARVWLHAGETTDPLGYALVRVAADWRQVGVTSPVPRPVLVALAPVYVAPATLEVDDEAVRRGLEWATTRISDTAVALLQPVAGGYSVLDYILDEIAAQQPPIPRRTWNAALEPANPIDLVSVGYQAAVEHGQLDVAETAWRRSAADGQAGAMFNLGVLLAGRGETVEAEQWYRKAAELNDPDGMS